MEVRSRAGAAAAFALGWLEVLGATPAAHAQCPSCERAELVPLDAEDRSFFGRVVAVSGDTLAVGSPGDDGQGARSGAVHVFEYSGTSWVEATKLEPIDGAAGDEFGVSIALSGDRLAVGSPGNDEAGVDGGAAYLFERVAGGWIQTAKVTNRGGRSSDGFGRSVGLLPDALLVGAYGRAVGSAESQGVVLGYRESGSGWDVAFELTANPGGAYRFFGRSLAGADGVILVGAPGYGSSIGSAHVFERRGDVWTWVTELRAEGASAGDLVGQSVSISDGVALVGSLFGDSAWLFQNVGGVWTQIDRWEGRGGFGGSVAIQGPRIVVGAKTDADGGPDAGAIYVYERHQGRWGLISKSISRSPHRGDVLGSSVAVSRQFEFAGAPNRGGPGEEYGAVFVFSTQRELRAGYVDTGDGSPPADVFTIDGSVGDSCREVVVAADTEVTIGVEKAPSLPDHGDFAVWIFEAAFCEAEAPVLLRRRGGDAYELGEGIRCLPVNNTVESGSCPCPYYFPLGWNSQKLGAARASALCLRPRPDLPPAPVTIPIVFPPGEFLLGGLVQDSNAINSPGKNISIGNWIAIHAVR